MPRIVLKEVLSSNSLTDVGSLELGAQNQEGMAVDNMEGFAAKVAEYVEHLYFSARTPGQERKTRKYSRKLKRLTDQFQKAK